MRRHQNKQKCRKSGHQVPQAAVQRGFRRGARWWPIGERSAGASSTRALLHQCSGELVGCGREVGARACRSSSTWRTNSATRDSSKLCILCGTAAGRSFGVCARVVEHWSGHQREGSRRRSTNSWTTNFSSRSRGPRVGGPGAEEPWLPTERPEACLVPGGSKRNCPLFFCRTCQYVTLDAGWMEG